MQSEHQPNHPVSPRRACAGLVLACALSLAVTTPAIAKAPPAVLKQLLKGADITASHVLPTAGGLVAVEAGGKFYILSKNGRFVFEGTLRDVWHDGRALGSMADIEHYALRLDLDGMEFDFSHLVTVRFGSGAKTVTAFVSLHCSACHKVVRSLRQLADTYAVRVVVVPSTSSDSAVERIACAGSEADKLALLMSGGGQTQVDDDVPAPPCDNAKAHLMTTMAVAQVLGIRRVPFIVAADGRVTQGLPRSQTLAGFLAGQENKK